MVTMDYSCMEKSSVKVLSNVVMQRFPSLS